MNIESINVTELKQMIDNKEEFELIDVREEDEYEICSIHHSQLIPLSVFQDRYQTLDENKEYIIHCKMGGRSARVCEFLMANGYKNVKNLEGGILAWAEEIDPSLDTY